MNTNTHPDVADVIAGAGAAGTGFGVLVMTFFPFALPLLILVAVAALPLLLLAIPVGLALGLRALVRRIAALRRSPTDQPKVNAYASAPASRNVISSVRSRTFPRSRSSW